MKKNLPPFLPYARQYIDKSDVDCIKSTITNDVITRGKNVLAFEQSVAKYCGAQHAVAFNSGTSALHAAYYAAETAPSDRIITTPNSFVATVGPGMLYSKMPPHFVDIDPLTRNMDLDKLASLTKQITSRGKNIIVPVHFSGIPVNMEKLELSITSPDTVIIEDAAHALGSAYYKGGPLVGSCPWSHMTIFSFHPAKIITTGEGGMALTNDATIAEKLRLFRNNGIVYKHDIFPWLYDVHDITGNFNVTEFQSALGVSQMKKLDTFIKYRKKIISWYRKELKKVPNVSLSPPSYDTHVAYHLCVINVDFAAYKTTREKVMNGLLAEGIGTQVHYIPLYRQPYFMKRLGDISADYPEMERYYAQALTLPLYYGLEEKSVVNICKTLKKVLKGK